MLIPKLKNHVALLTSECDSGTWQQTHAVDSDGLGDSALNCGTVEVTSPVSALVTSSGKYK